MIAQPILPLCDSEGGRMGNQKRSALKRHSHHIEEEISYIEEKNRYIEE